MVAPPRSFGAEFDPAPPLDAFWSDALKLFRAIPRRDFGFKVVLRVVEDEAPAGANKMTLLQESRPSLEECWQQWQGGIHAPCPHCQHFTALPAFHSTAGISQYC
jgi:hypothetical protein